jgi:predicted secreted hydrolase
VSAFGPALHRRGALIALAALPSLARAANPRAEPRTLEFPRDHGAHPEFRIEWWYATGWLAAGSASYGFQLTFFRSRTDVAAGNPSRYAARQLLFAHAALTDLGARRLLHAERSARWSGDPQARQAAARLDDTHVHLGDWRLQRGTDGRYAAALGGEGFAYELTLAPTQPLLLQGDAGFSRKGPDAAQASHYVSEPQLVVSGTLVRAGQRAAVQGRAWLDHEWSEALMHPEAVGWDWIGINWDDGRGALTAFRLRRADGSALWAGGSFRAAGDAPLRNFADPGAVRFEPGRVWRSPRSGAAYPVEWTLDTPAGRFQVRALLDDQELDSRASTGAIYWEGLSELLDARGQRIGRGYLEMTGYAAPLRLGA